MEMFAARKAIQQKIQVCGNLKIPLKNNATMSEGEERTQRISDEDSQCNGSQSGSLDSKWSCLNDNTRIILALQEVNEELLKLQEKNIPSTKDHRLKLQRLYKKCRKSNKFGLKYREEFLSHLSQVRTALEHLECERQAKMKIA